ncbi:MAG: hypothetical protein Q9225_006573 [Loekoesia sp. 1 TL-2023]
MPLKGLLEILSDTKEKKPLASKFGRNYDKIRILKKDDFKPFDKIKSEDITDEFLGYFSLLTSYCVVARLNNPTEGLKRSLPIMPRTDFAAQYRQFVEQKLQAQFCDGETSLYDVVQKVSGRDDKLAKEKFRWTPGIRRNIDEKWKGMEDDLKDRRLEVEKFLNYIQGYDKKADEQLDQMDLVKLMDRSLRHGQIGSLNNRMETVLGSDRLAPIFEFRELQQAPGNQLGDTLGSYEDKVIYYHKLAPKKRSIHLVAMVNNAPICQDKCPNGQKKNQKGDECEPDCPAGQVPKVTGDGCESCVKGEKPNAKGDKCQMDDGNQDKCADGEAKTGAGGKCEACAKDQKPTAGGDKLVGVALGGIEGVDFASDEGAALINAEAKDVADNWPSGVEFKDMDLGNSNIEPEIAKASVIGIEIATRKRSAKADLFTPAFKVESSKHLIRPSRRSVSTNLALPSGFTPTFIVDPKPETSGLHRRFFWLIPSIVKAASGAGRGAVRAGGSATSKIANEAIKTGKAFKNTKPEAGNPARIVSQVGKDTKVPSKPAKFDEKIKTIKDNKSFKDCLALAAVSTVGNMAFHAGSNVPQGGFKAEEKALVLTVFTEEDNKGGSESTIQTYNDDFYYTDRLIPGTCSDFEEPFENSITGYNVALGYCKFYKDSDCKSSIFAATNREHANLQDDANNSISSVAYIFDMDCKDLPP